MIKENYYIHIIKKITINIDRKNLIDIFKLTQKTKINIEKK